MRFLVFLSENIGFMKVFYRLFFFVSLLSFTTTQAQEFPKLDASPMDLAIVRGENQQMIARVIYSRPQKKGREVFGNLVPLNEIWRTGANEATELDLYIPMRIGDTLIDAGTYTLFSIPKKDEWVIILNTKTNIWGLSYDSQYDFLQIKVPSKSAAAPIESLSMAFRPDTEGFSLMIGWDDRYVEVPFEFVEE